MAKDKYVVASEMACHYGMGINISLHVKTEIYSKKVWFEIISSRKLIEKFNTYSEALKKYNILNRGIK